VDDNATASRGDKRKKRKKKKKEKKGNKRTNATRLRNKWSETPRLRVITPISDRRARFPKRGGFGRRPACFCELVPPVRPRRRLIDFRRLRETRLTPGRIANREWERPICAEGDGSRRRGDKTRRGERVRAIDFLLGFSSPSPPLSPSSFPGEIASRAIGDTKRTRDRVPRD